MAGLLDFILRPLAGGLLGYDTADFNKELSANQYELQRQQFDYQKEYDSWAKSFAQSQFDYQKQYDSNNEIMKANQFNQLGINPIMMTGAGTSSVGVSSPSSNVQSSGSPSPVDAPRGAGILSFMGSLLNSALEKKSQDNDMKKFNDMLSSQMEQFYAKLKNDKEIADSKNETDMKIASGQFTTAERDRFSRELIARLDRASSEDMAMAQRALQRELQDKQSSTSIAIQEMKNSNDEKSRQNAIEIEKMANKTSTKNTWIFSLSQLGGKALQIMSKFITFGGSNPIGFGR